MRSTIDVERTVAQNGFEPRPEGHRITVTDVFQFAAVAGARALGQEHRLGTVEAGKVADLQFIRTDSLNMLPVLEPMASVVFHANVSDIDTVLVEGQPVKRGGRLLMSLDVARSQVEQSVARLYWGSEELPEDAIRPDAATRQLFLR